MNQPPPAAIRTEQLTKRFRGKTAVDQLSLTVPQGSVFGLLGENGAGKTTLLRMLLGLAAPDGGQAEVLGLDPRRRGREVRRSVGYVPERPCLYDWMRVDELGWFAAGFYPNGFCEHYDEIVARFGLAPEKRIRELSKGMQAKVSLALALGPQPPLLILDEPTSGLDLMVRREFLESVVDLAGQGRTVLFSSHQVAEVERVADWVGILHAGRLVACEPLEKLKDEVCEITLVMSSAEAATPPLATQVLSQNAAGAQRVLVVRGCDAEHLEVLRRHSAVRDLRRRGLSLEEIFLAYMQNDKTVIP